MEITLGQNRSYQIREKADAIAITLSENQQGFGNFSPSWQLDIYTSSDQGRDYLGTINTVAAVNGVFPSRIVAYAISPGARAWNIEATGPRAGPAGGGVFSAELRAHPVDPSPAGLGPGIFRPLGRIIMNGNLQSEVGTFNPPPAPARTAPLVGSRTDFVAPIAFLGASGSNESGVAGETIWFMFFNSATIPPNGTEPTDGLSFPVQTTGVSGGGMFNFQAPGPNGIFFSQGLTWAASSLPATLQIINGPVARVVTYATW